MSNKKRTTDAVLPLLQKTSTYKLWRTLPASFIVQDHSVTGSLISLLQSVTRHSRRHLPEHALILEDISRGDFTNLPDVLESLPETPEQGKTQAGYDLKMTLVFWAVLSTCSRQSNQWESQDRYQGALAKGLILQARHQMPDDPHSLIVPRKKRNKLQRSRIRQWRQERTRLRMFAEGWLAVTDWKMHLPTYEYSSYRKTKSAEAELSSSDRLPTADEPQIVVVDSALPPGKGGRDSLGKTEIAYWDRLTRPVRLVGQELNPDQLAEDLLKEFPWMMEPISRITDDLKFQGLSKHGAWFRFHPLLLVGPAGCGKTRFARRLSEKAGLGFRTINLGGSSDNRDLHGTARGWGTAEPSAVLRAVREHQQGNPCLFVDEVEKAAGDGRNGKAQDTLLSLIEPESSKNWYDECLCVNVDLSHVNWILAANSTSGISEPLLSRVSVVEIGLPSLDDYPFIHKSIMNDIAKELGVPRLALPELDGECQRYLREQFERGLPVRRLKVAIRRGLSASMDRAKVIH